jgi:hypothetical protein
MPKAWNWLFPFLHCAPVKWSLQSEEIIRLQQFGKKPIVEGGS